MPAVGPAIGWVFAQALVGALLGAVLGARWPTRRTVVTVVGGGAALWAGNLGVGWWGAWDLAVLIAVASIAAAGAAGLRPLRWWGGHLAGGLAGLVVLEVGVRLWLPPGPFLGGLQVVPFAPLSVREHNVVGGIYQDERMACAHIFDPPAIAPVWGPRVVHVGDSIVYGLGLTPGMSLPHFLQGMDPGRVHVSRAIPGLGTDVLARVAEAALPQTDLLVFYIFGGNDVMEIGLGLPCCPEGVVELASGRRRCETARPQSVWRDTLYRSPPPLALRVAAEISQAARWTYGWWARMVRHGGFVGVVGTTDQAERVLLAEVARVERAAQAAEVPVLFVFLPASEQTFQRSDDAIRDGLNDLGVPWIDVEPWIASWEGDAPLHLDDGIHWSRVGLRTLAGWLLPEMDRVLGVGRDDRVAPDGESVDPG